MPMTLKQLTKLFILQKNHLQQVANAEHEKRFEDEFARLLPEAEIIREDRMAAPLFKDQPKIPFVLFAPKNATRENPRPLIIQTHGGPNVYMDKENLHAEIAYFVSHGFVVACPNYRGSTGYPAIGDAPVGWKAWEARSKDKHHIYGPQDVFAVTKEMHKLPFVDGTKTVLRGGSYGSFVNSHLLAGVAKGIYENIFRGAHLSGGVKYPIASLMPNIPLLITHSVQDDIAPYGDARIFMENVLLKRLAHELEHDGRLGSVQTFVSNTGNHHLIAPGLDLNDEVSPSYVDLELYLRHSTKFIHAVSVGVPYQPVDTYEQFKSVIVRQPGKELDEDILQRVHAYKFVHEDKTELIPTQATPILKPVAGAPLRFMAKVPAPSFGLSTVPMRKYHGPTMALLQLQLGAEFTGIVQLDLRTYLHKHFAPVKWDMVRPKIHDAGRQILQNQDFFIQMVTAVAKEEDFLKQNPGYMVMYHTAENNSTIQLYSFINLWQTILKGRKLSKLPVIEEMRLYDFMKETFEDIEPFLIKMRRRRQPNDLFNNIAGFAERVIACNPALISSAHSTASSSLWWYFKTETSAGLPPRTPIDTVVGEMLKILGIYSPERMARYVQLFHKATQSLMGTQQSLLQQIFVPIELAKKSAYMCQLWGEEFSENDLALSSPGVVADLIDNPDLFEQNLRKNKAAFNNFGDCPGFGDTAKGFKYANALQLRFLLRNDSSIVTNSYFRSMRRHQDFVTELTVLIQEDYADFLVRGPNMPDFVIKDVEAAKTRAYSQSSLSMFKPNAQANYEALYKQQHELFVGLVQNPRKELYGDIIRLDSATKTKLQLRLRESNDGKESGRPVFLYSLCRYLKGYTYYDLIKEAAEEMIVNDSRRKFDGDMIVKWKFSKEDPAYTSRLAKVMESCNDHLQFLMKTIDEFCIPAAIDTLKMTSARYERLKQLLTGLKGYPFNSQKHEFIQSGPNVYYNSYNMGLELDTAIHCVLRYAKLAKEKDNGYKVTALNSNVY